MSEAVEHAEHIEHAGHHNKGVALLIALLALGLAFTETLGKSAQTSALAYNVQVNDTWAFYQARNIRATTVTTAKEALEVEAATATDPGRKAALTKKIEDWDKRVKKWESDPEKHEGMKELMAKAKSLETQQEHAMEQYHNYEIGSAALQIGIVLASASIITSMIVLAWIGGGLGIVGVIFMFCGLYAPEFILHMFASGHGVPGH
jgi:hypothetical protein